MKASWGGHAVTDPYTIAWSDQFHALVRDKVYESMKAIEITQWKNIATEFNDPYDEDRYCLSFDGNSFWLENLVSGNGAMIQIDLGKLGLA